ncbi:MAG: energy-coupling factor ABC transporter ATP-binding protein [Synergistaceae bacterium]|jgi:tungstate transport system ATP-binding protein|nr:energy-coupling factor ABC transporter ATP-binding protein [Synergistaceae bacterium]
MKNIYSLRAVTHSYGEHHTLDVESLDIPEGGVTGLTGPNGSGKSTLLKILAFLQPPRSGKLLFGGEPSSGREREIRRDVTLLLQDPFLLRRTVFENIAYGLKLRGISRAETETRVRDAMARVGMATEDFAPRPWFRLSGGEAQRVSLAVRLALRPRVLLLDEPTANVDEASAILIKEAVVRARRDWGTTIVIASHDLAWLHDVATEIVGMYGGRVVGDGAANLIRGDWRIEGPEDRYVSIMLDGFKITADAPQPGILAKCAALSPSDINVTVSPAASPDGHNSISCTLTQMSMERTTGSILCATDCGGISLKARISPDLARELKLCPGMRLTLSFPREALKFISSLGSV